MPESSIKRDVLTKGYTFVENLSPHADIFELANAIGTPIVPKDGGAFQKLVPKALATPNTYSGIYGLARFPFHTDLAHWRIPPRYLLLRCQIGYDDVSTLLADGKDLVASVTTDTLSRAIVRARRPIGGKHSLQRLYETLETGHCFRWDETFIVPASKMGEVARQSVIDWLLQCSTTSIALARKNDTLIIDNWRMLHSRSQVPAGRENRTIERVYLRELK